MIRLSKAIALANEAIFSKVKKNPWQKISQLGDWVYDFPVFTDDMTYRPLDSGSFSTVILASNGKVYIMTRGKGDLSKTILADLNEKLGPQPNLPIIRYIGEHNWYGKNDPISIFESELYQVGSIDFWLQHPRQKQYLQTLLRIPEHTFWSTFAEPDMNGAYSLVEAEFGIDMVDPDLQEAEWEDIVDSLNILVTFIGEHYPNVRLIKDVGINNVALDGEGQFILLDIFVAKDAFLEWW
jgi:hypothetical protein